VLIKMAKKGDYEIFTTPLSALLFVGAVISLGLLIATSFINYKGTLVNAVEDLNAIDAAHLIKDCFAEDKGHISADFLNSVSRKNVCDVCGLCSVSVSVKVEDIENKKEWVFGDASTSYQHHIFINIGYPNEVHVGKLYVSI